MSRSPWESPELDVRMKAVACVTDRSTLESIVESSAPSDVRRAAAERLFQDGHIRTHARIAVRDAAVAVVEDRAILRALADEDSEPRIRAKALIRLGEDASVQVCGVCEETSLASVERCECGFSFRTGDLSAARRACVEVRRRGTRLLITAGFVVAIGLAGGMTLLPVHFAFTLGVGDYKMDLVLVIAGLGLAARGRSLRARPWHKALR
jgi:hypothetical protein